jgi:uncharacterized protein (TIRG00374 family)
MEAAEDAIRVEVAGGDGAALAAVKPQRGKRLVRLMLGLILTGGLFAYLVWGGHVRLDEVVTAVRQVRPWWLVVSAVVAIGNRFLMALKWWLLLRAEEIGVRLGPVVVVQYMSYFLGRALPGAVGMDVVRAWYLTREQEHESRAVIVASVVFDRVTNMVALAAIALAAVLVTEVPLPGRGAVVVAGAVLCGGFAVVGLVSRPLERLLSRRQVRGVTRWKRMLRSVHRVVSSLSRYHGRPAVVGQTLAAGLVVQTVRCMEVYLVFVALGRPDTLAESLVLAPIVMFIVMIPLGLSSVAVGAGAMVIVAGPLGIGSATALTAAVLLDVIGLVLIPVGAVCYLWRSAYLGGDEASAGARG